MFTNATNGIQQRVPAGLVCGELYHEGVDSLGLRMPGHINSAHPRCEGIQLLRDGA